MKHDEKVGLEFNQWVKDQREVRMADGHAVLVEWVYDRWNRTNKSNGRILDVGCGVGNALKRAKNHGFNEFYGVDLSSSMIEKAKLHFDEGHFQVASGQSLPFEENYFDAVISVESLYYHQDPLESLKEIFRVLKPNGVFGSPIELYQENPVGEIWSTSLDNLDILNWSEKTWLKKLNEAGFKNTSLSRIQRELDHTKETFKQSVHFPSFEIYTEYCNQGALYLEGLKSS